MAILQQHNKIGTGDRVSWRLDGDARRFGVVNYVEVSWTRCGGKQYHYNVTDNQGVQRRISAHHITKESG